MRKIFCALAMSAGFWLYGCSSYQVSKPVINGDMNGSATEIDADLKTKLGKYRIGVGVYESGWAFKYLRQEIIDGLAVNGSIPSDKRSKIVDEASRDLVWEEDRYFGFGIS